MKYEFIDEMFERLLVKECKTFGEAFVIIIKERAKIIQDLGRIENAYQLFCKRHPESGKSRFRDFIRVACPEDYVKCVRLFAWK